MSTRLKTKDGLLERSLLPSRFSHLPLSLSTARVISLPETQSENLSKEYETSFQKTGLRENVFSD